MWLEIIAAELTENSVSLWEYVCKSESGIAVIFWNEVDGVMEKTLKEVDAVVEIPMQWIKESMNVGQSTAIFMRANQRNKSHNYAYQPHKQTDQIIILLCPSR